MRIYDFDGNEATPAWLLAEFGGVEVFEVDMPDGAWKLTDVYARRGCQMPAGMEVTAKRRDGSPADGLEVILWEEGTPNNVARFTNGAGLARFDVGQEQMYSVPGRGRWAVRVRKPNSDRLAGIGRVLTHGKKVADKWLDPVFQFVVGEPEPPTPPEPPEPISGIKVFDAHGMERDADWLAENYGAVTVETPADGCKFVLNSLIEDDTGDLAISVVVLGANGQSLLMQRVVWWWENAPVAPGAGWLEQGEVYPTWAGGEKNFSMGQGGAYFPPAGGPHAIWLYGPGTSQIVKGLGWVGLTEHHHLHLVFRMAG